MKQKILFEINKFGKKTENEIVAFFFSNRKRCADLKEVIKNLPKNSAIIFREYDLEDALREKMAREIVEFCHAQKIKILIGKNLELARKLKADGVHFSDFDNIPLEIIDRKNKSENFIFSFACHNELSVLESKKLGADLIFVSPVFATKSHFNVEPVGLERFSKIVSSTKTRVFALGGVNEKNIDDIAKAGAAGFGAIEFFCD